MEENINGEVIIKTTSIKRKFAFEKLNIIPVPVIEAKSKSFTESLKIEITTGNANDEIYYMLQIPAPGKPVWLKYESPIEILATSEWTAPMTEMP